MSCDIHLHAEVKINGTWHHYAQPECYQYYPLFEKMAGVRGDVAKAIAAPRGLPDDASVVTKFDAEKWGEDGHSHSWLSATEIAQLAAWEKALHAPDYHAPTWDGWLFGQTYSGFTKYPEDRPAGLEDVRFVFWFDN